jgi:hypothetical protein
MPVVLEIISGPRAGQRIELPEDGTLLIGRRSPSQRTFPDDVSMSSVHFLIRGEGGACSITDQSSTNGTWVNNKRIKTAHLQPGDRVQAGGTEFVVHPAAAQVSLESVQLSFGSWIVPSTPQGWEAVSGQGLKLTGEDSHSNVIFAEDSVLDSAKTEDYVASQREVMRRFLPDLKISGTELLAASGGGEALAVENTFRSSAGETVYQRQLYVRRGKRIGIITTTTVEKERGKVRADFDAILASARFEPAATVE